MHPVIAWIEVQGRNLPIGSYGTCLALAFLVALWVLGHGASRARLDTGAVLAVGAGAVAGALLGGWAGFVGLEWLRTGSPWAGIHQGGLNTFGALLGAGVATATAARLGRQPLGPLLDLAVLPLACAQALARVGCFLGGCGHGRAWSGWDVADGAQFHPLTLAAEPTIARHPVALYEAGLVLILAWWVQRLRPKVLAGQEPRFRAEKAFATGDGRRMWAYLAGYAVVRLFLEPWRGDVTRGWWDGRVSSSQALAVGLLVIACGALWRAQQKGTRHAETGRRYARSS